MNKDKKWKIIKIITTIILSLLIIVDTVFIIKFFQLLINGINF